MNTNTSYRKFNIHRETASMTRETDFVWEHESFDGPGDDRWGYGANVQECHARIDEYWEERDAELTSRGYEP